MLPARLIAGYAQYLIECEACGARFKTFDKQAKRCDNCIKKNRRKPKKKGIIAWVDEVFSA